jgi:hypothetical protein
VVSRTEQKNSTSKFFSIVVKGDNILHSHLSYCIQTVTMGLLPVTSAVFLTSKSVWWPIGAMVRILACCARCRGFDTRTVQTFVCMIMPVYFGSGRFLYVVCMYIQKKYIRMYISPLSRIHNTSFVSAYHGLDKRECKWLEYLFTYFGKLWQSRGNIWDVSTTSRIKREWYISTNTRVYL